jgi:hypothetical protein
MPNTTEWELEQRRRVIDVELVDRYLVVTQQDQTWLQRNASEQQREFWFVHVSKSVDMRDDEAGCCAKINASFFGNQGPDSTERSVSYRSAAS